MFSLSQVNALLGFSLSLAGLTCALGGTYVSEGSKAYTLWCHGIPVSAAFLFLYVVVFMLR